MSLTYGLVGTSTALAVIGLCEPALRAAGTRRLMLTDRA